ncbi:hypothetical protein KFE80_01205 [bacterium SCSIO 12696]|nr:hypothetical protein KFE80_01205 [bacterium SCSIO 12696]
MANTIFVRQTRSGDYHWFADGVELAQGSLAQFKADLSSLSNARVWLLLPGNDVVFNQLPCSARERRHLRKAAPYELEEQLIDEVDQLHFGFAHLSDDQLSIACCDHQWLQQLLDHFQQAGIEVHHMVPEILLLPWQPETWTLAVRGQSIVVRCGASQGFALEPALIPMALQQLVQQDKPQRVLLLAGSDEQLQLLRRMLPEALQAQCDAELQSWPQTVIANSPTKPPLDMRQGAFSNHLPVRRWWQHWQRVAVVVAVALVVFVAGQWAQYSDVKQQGLQLQQQISTTVSQALSRRTVGDSQRQLNALKSELRKRRGNATGSYNSPSAMLADVMPVFAASKGVLPGNFTFSGRNGELRMNCWAPSFEALQTIQSQLEKRRYQVRFTASADGDGQQGNFRIQRQSAPNAVAGR